MKVKFSRCSSNNLASVPQVDGQLIYTKDTGDVYLDVGNQRHKVSNFIVESAKENISNPSLDKIYFISEENKLYKYLGLDVQTEEPIWIDLSGASESYADTKSQEAKNYADANFLKKDNTTAYTPTQQYHPATKGYVDTNAVTFKPFLNSFATTGTTLQFLDSIETQHLGTGMAYLGRVTLSDMPDGVWSNAEVEVYIYPSNVVYCVMRSADVSPYQWECNSYDYRGWEGIDKTAKDYTDTVVGNINAILDEINGVEV